VSTAVISAAPPSGFDYNLSCTSYVYDEDMVLWETQIVMINSTGSAYCYYSYKGDRAPLTVSIGSGLSQNIIDRVRDALTLDDVFALDGIYNDAAEAAEVGRDYDQLNLTSMLGDRELEFSGYAMMGIMPNTYVSLRNVESYLYDQSVDELSVEVSVLASLSLSGELEASAQFHNSGSNNLTLTGMTTSYWQACIVKRNGCFVAEFKDPTILPTTFVEVPAHSTVDFDPEQRNATGVATGEYVVMADLNFLGFTILNITQDLGHENEPPIISWLTMAGGADTIVFDASASCDKEDFKDDLMVRWDWGNDGVWDSNWSTRKTFIHAFGEDGEYSIHIEVRDTEGAVSSVTLEVSEESIGNILIAGALILVIIVAVILVYFVFLRKEKPGTPK
jgi:hypothetical protein